MHFEQFIELDKEQVEELKQTKYNITRNSSKKEISDALEVITIHLFAILTGNLYKFDHNLFQVQDRFNSDNYGPLIYIDNDRSQWNHSPAKFKQWVTLNPFLEFCKFPARIGHKILLLRSGNDYDITLGEFIYEVSSLIFEPEMKNHGLFSKEEAVTLNRNVDFIANMIDKCLESHPYDDVLIPEPWDTPDIFNFQDIFKNVNDYSIINNKALNN